MTLTFQLIKQHIKIAAVKESQIPNQKLLRYDTIEEFNVDLKGEYTA